MPKLNQQGLIGVILLSLVLLSGIVGGGVYIATRNADNSQVSQNDDSAKPTSNIKEDSATISGQLKTTNKKAQLPTTIDDNFRDQYMSKVAYLIDQFHRKNFKQGTDGKFTYQLPSSLDELDLSSIGGDLDPRIKQFTTTELKYIIPANDFLLCAKFDKPVAEIKTGYFKQKVSTSRVSSDYQCFEMGTFIYENMVPQTYQTTNYTDIKNYDLEEAAKITKSTTFADPNIATAEAVTSEGNRYNLYHLNFEKQFTTLIDFNGGKPNPKDLQKETGTVNFPFGFFSSNSVEWGFAGKVTKLEDRVSGDHTVITPVISPLQVRIIFKTPVKLASISNLFTNCQHIECYTWEASGINSNNQPVKLVEPTVAGFDPNLPSAKGVASQDLLKEITIKTTRTDTEMEGTFVRPMVWKKIKLYYSQ